jgi:hypothetical protein
MGTCTVAHRLSLNVAKSDEATVIAGLTMIEKTGNVRERSASEKTGRQHHRPVVADLGR